MRLCDVDGCDRRHYARGWCSRHWARMYERGRLDRVNREGGTSRYAPLGRDELIRLRRQHGVPDDGPTEEERRRWRRHEQEEEIT